jgi:hypothetical protein
MGALLTVLRYTDRAIMLPFSSARINSQGAWVQSGRGMPLAGGRGLNEMARSMYQLTRA